MYAAYCEWKLQRHAENSLQTENLATVPTFYNSREDLMGDIDRAAVTPSRKLAGLDHGDWLQQPLYPCGLASADHKTTVGVIEPRIEGPSIDRNLSRP